MTGKSGHEHRMEVDKAQHAGGHGHAAHDHETPTEREAMEHATHGREIDERKEGHVEQHGDHDGHMDHTGHEEMFRRRFWVSLVLAFPVLLYSPMLQEWFGFTMPEFPGSRWIGPIFSTVIFLYGGLPFLQMARMELRNRQPGMMTLISLAILVAFGYSWGTLLFDPMGGFFWELVTLIVVMLLGHWIEMRSVRQASRALDELAKLLPDEAERVRPQGGTETVPVDSLREGDVVLVRPGASVPADGEVMEGNASLDESMITGESTPVRKEPGDSVVAGTIAGDGSLRVRVSATGEKTALAGIMRLVEQAQQSRSRSQLLADRAAAWLFYIALAAAAVTAVAWTGATGFNVDVVERVATVLVIACPHALGLAIPLVVAISTTLGARNGVLVRDRLALEEARNLDTVIFDKTGTLTEGAHGLVGLATAGEQTEEEALALAAAVEGDSEHMIARGLRRAAEERGVSLPPVEAFEAMKGRGVQAHVEGQTLHVGGPALLKELSLEVPQSLAGFTEEASNNGQTVVYLVRNNQITAAFALADRIRQESYEAVRRLHEMGMEVALVTGDSEGVARAVAEELGIDRYFAGVLPDQKAEKVAALMAENKTVAMVGDGINDAPALARANVGIAIGSGTDVAIESAGIVLVQNDPLDVIGVIELSRASYRKMVQNLVWATGYNVVALPLAAGILAPIGILLSPAVGALLMSLSTVIVAINAQFLRRFKMAT